MSTKAMYDLKETLCTELDQYARKDSLTRTDLDTVHVITDTIKNFDKITQMEEDGSSYGMGDWTANGSYSNGMPTRYSGRGHMNGNYGRRYSGDDDTEYVANRMRREMY